MEGISTFLGIQKEGEEMKDALGKQKASVLIGLAVSLLFASGAFSQETYPNRPVTCVVAFSPGGATDLAFRLLTKEAERYLGQPIVILNKPGAGGTIGVSAVATAKPDGYTFGTAPSGGFLAIMPYIEKIPYHPIKDLKYIMQFASLNFGVMVNTSSPFKSFKEMMAFARQNPKKLTYGTNAPNSISNLIMEQIAKKEGVQLTHIPFKGSAEYQTALIGGHVGCIVGEFNYSLLEAGQIRILLSLAEKKSEDYPQIPITKDLGYDIPCPVYNGIAGPKDMPDEIVKKVDEAFSRGMKEQAFIKGMKDLHVTILYRNSKELTEYATYNYELFGKILKEMGIAK
jgi:tripartite-type tricarboxylate transporter receptor subunit TctC